MTGFLWPASPVWRNINELLLRYSRNNLQLLKLRVPFVSSAAIKMMFFQLNLPLPTEQKDNLKRSLHL